MSDFEKSMVEITKRANDFVHEKRAEGITVIPAREFFEAIGIIDFFFGNDVGIDISNFKGDKNFHCGFEESGFHAYNCNDCPNKCEEWYQWDKEMKKGDK